MDRSDYFPVWQAARVSKMLLTFFALPPVLYKIFYPFFLPPLSHKWSRLEAYWLHSIKVDCDHMAHKVSQPIATGGMRGVVVVLRGFFFYLKLCVFTYAIESNELLDFVPLILRYGCLSTAKAGKYKGYFACLTNVEVTQFVIWVSIDRKGWQVQGNFACLTNVEVT
ncbi:hypothetical protein CDAR_252121 [Caerostris darwini]|uniref:Uncharacterized protein n=1 Tax=Caerostris darwini TaxID=1538125 RepID=A0AAV4QCT5_9ARAC|nr:hypothetical protein CDAR_252121 [Caerostris darwini]